MTRALVAIFTATLVTFVVAGCGGSSNGSEPVDYAAHAFDGGGAVSTAGLRGKPLLLTSWATWCGVCKTELPKVERFFKQHQRRGLQVVAVNINAEGASYQAKRMASTAGLTMPLWVDPDNVYTGVFRGVGVPTTVLLDADGRIVHVWQGELNPSDPAVVETIEATLPA